MIVIGEAPQLLREFGIATVRASRVSRTLEGLQKFNVFAEMRIFSPFMFWVVPTASRLVAVPRPGMSMLINGRKMKCVRRQEIH
jgi:hypothetical protein